MTTAEDLRRNWSGCDHCGVHEYKYQTSGDEVLDLCPCCYGGPYDGEECTWTLPDDLVLTAARAVDPAAWKHEAEDGPEWAGAARQSSIARAMHVLRALGFDRVQFVRIGDSSRDEMREAGVLDDYDIAVMRGMALRDIRLEHPKLSAWMEERTHVVWQAHWSESGGVHRGL